MRHNFYRGLKYHQAPVFLDPRSLGWPTRRGGLWDFRAYASFIDLYRNNSPGPLPDGFDPETAGDEGLDDLLLLSYRTNRAITITDVNNPTKINSAQTPLVAFFGAEFSVF